MSHSFDPEIDDLLERETSSNSSVQRAEFILENYILKPQNIAHSKPRRSSSRRYIKRDHVEGHNRLFADYFSNNPLYNDDLFRRRFRMHRHVFLRIVGALENRYEFFTLRTDATGNPGASTLQKCTAAIRMLAYGIPTDALDDYLRMGESTVMECTKEFVKCVIECFGEEYMRRPNEQDLRRLLYYGDMRGFPGMLGSLDCMYWEWKNCPKAWQGSYGRGDHGGKPTIMLEAVASFDTWIWHSLFGVPGANNDINVIDRSPLFNEVLEGRVPKVGFTVSGNRYDKGYYLTDGIYPNWAVFVKSISCPQLPYHKLFAMHQESARKDVEQAFGVLQARFAIIRCPGRLCEVVVLGNIMRACIIMHNMIVEDERDRYMLRPQLPHYGQANTEITTPEFHNGYVRQFDNWLQQHVDIRSEERHKQLQDDLMTNIWQRYHMTYKEN